ncbi:MAG: VanZ family protein [Pseudomonadota bacterium]
MTHERSLRWPLLWFGGGALLCTYIIYAALTPITLFVPTTLWDKASHAVAFFVLTVWFSALVARRHMGRLVIGMIVLGIAIEVAQSFIPSRHPDVLDIVADVIGITAGYAGAMLGLSYWVSWAEAALAWFVNR